MNIALAAMKAVTDGGEKQGPYKYRVYRDGETVRRNYLGTAVTEK